MLAFAFVHDRQTALRETADSIKGQVAKNHVEASIYLLLQDRGDRWIDIGR